MNLTEQKRRELLEMAARPVPKTQMERIRADAELAQAVREWLPEYEQLLANLEKILDEIEQSQKLILVL